MENRGIADDVVDLFKDSSADDDERIAPAGAATRLKDLTDANIMDDDFAEELPPDFPRMALSSTPSGSPPFSSLKLRPASKLSGNGGRDVARRIDCVTKRLEHAPQNETIPSTGLRMVDSIKLRPAQVSGNGGRDVARRIDCDTKRLEHAPQNETMPSTGLRMEDSLERPPVVFASNLGVAPGAFPVRPSRNNATSQTFGSPAISYDTARQFTHEESKHEDGVPNSSEGNTGAHDNNRATADESGLYTVEARRVPDRNEEETIMVAEAEYVRTKWYQRRWISLGGILLGFSGTVVVLVVFANRSQAAAGNSSLTSPVPIPTTAAPTAPDPIRAPPSRTPITSVTPTAKPTYLTPELIACSFLFIPNLTMCRSTIDFSDRTTGSTIPSEIGLLTQLKGLDVFDNALASTIPTEIGLLTQLTFLSFYNNALTSRIPTEIGLLSKLEWLQVSFNMLTGTIPPSLCSLSSLQRILIDCGEIACETGCCTGSDYRMCE